MSAHAFVLDTEATPDTVRGILGDVRGYLDTLGLDEDICGNVEIAMAEALNNIVEHAYAPACAGPVRLCAGLVGDRLLVDLHDSGKAMPGRKLPNKNLPDAACQGDSLPEGGFGWFLIHDLTTAVCYRRVGAQNRLRLEFALIP